MPATPFKHRPARAWQKISITVDSRMTEAVAAHLAALTGAGLEISTLEDSRPPTGCSATEKITAYLALAPGAPATDTVQEKIEELHRFLARARDIFADCPRPRLQVETITEEDWGEKWKRFFTALQITPTLTIKPSWEDAAAEADRSGTPGYVIEMDPGLAFGTGHHASTQLALLLLEELFQNSGVKPRSVLDVGTGSGILAIAGALFGAANVVALDNDPDAVETAKQNIVGNRLQDRISVSGRDAASLRHCFDVVVANITHDVLTALAEVLIQRLQASGFLVLSGILRGDQEHSIRTVYEKKGLQWCKGLVKDEWAALLFQKK